jgi:hypothetical protein
MYGEYNIKFIYLFKHLLDQWFLPIFIHSLYSSAVLPFIYRFYSHIDLLLSSKTFHPSSMHLMFHSLNSFLLLLTTFFTQFLPSTSHYFLHSIPSFYFSLLSSLNSFLLLLTTLFTQFLPSTSHYFLHSISPHITQSATHNLNIHHPLTLLTAYLPRIHPNFTFHLFLGLPNTRY